ncbi:hypothetical protein [Roseomonas indoligenes]|uniref:Uncharacterized protein n=1 Tax=Roseomonas indoligenes TaxID=2820811 RepID=A0A940S6C4_9PROT|nr:hypothetical protein [Pararoseomonas indoligenes]MBP0491818.1 hypothetical protein [Pararoseomonas indoligenes]
MQSPFQNTRFLTVGNTLSSPQAALSDRAVAHLAAETLVLGCLYQRRGGAYVRIPVHRRQQFTGCEWHCRRVDGRLVSVGITCEPLEEWLTLAETAPDDVVELYRGILGRRDIPANELFWGSDIYTRSADGYDLVFAAGEYNPLNAWNTVRGAVHINGSARGGFDTAPADDTPPRLRLRLPKKGLLFLGGVDMTAEVLRVSRDDGRGWIDRLEVAVPAGEHWALSELVLASGDRFTPLGLVEALVGDIARPPAGQAARPMPILQPAWKRPRASGDRLPFLPGRMVADALLRQLGAAQPVVSYA